ncbi:MAG: glycosyltransferase family 2 protein [Actinomycetota bacterium]
MINAVPDPDRRTSPAWPDVDVVMPIRDEADHLIDAVESVDRQNYPGRMTIILGVGPSTDATEDLAADLAASRHDLVVVPNPSGRTPSGLNQAIMAGDAPIVVRVDGHSQLSPGYIERAVRVLQRTGAANVGGSQVPTATTPFEEAVASATSSWMGTGGAAYRIGTEAGPTDTVYLGVFDRHAVESVGLFDERLVRNQDYELNIRLRAAGHVVWFDPELRVGYRPRGSWRSLVHQYFQYGWWKAEVVRMHPASFRARQVIAASAAPVATVGVALAVWRAPRIALVVVAAVGAAATTGQRWLQRPLIVAGTNAVVWSAGFLTNATATTARAMMGRRR